MTHPLQITFRAFPTSEALQERVQSKFDKLRQVCPEITSCHVVFEAPHRRHTKGGLFEVKIELAVPGHFFSVSRECHQDHSHEDAHVALRDAFDRARRQLVAHNQRVHGHPRVNALAPTG